MWHERLLTAFNEACKDPMVKDEVAFIVAHFPEVQLCNIVSSCLDKCPDMKAAVLDNRKDVKLKTSHQVAMLFCSQYRERNTIQGHVADLLIRMHQR